MKSLIVVALLGVAAATKCNTAGANVCNPSCTEPTDMTCTSCASNVQLITLKDVVATQGGVSTDKLGGFDIAKELIVVANVTNNYGKAAFNLRADIDVSLCMKKHVFFGDCAWGLQPTGGVTHNLDPCDASSGIHIIEPNDCTFQKDPNFSSVTISVDLTKNKLIGPLIGTIKLLAHNKRVTLGMTIRDGDKALACIDVFDTLL